MASLETLWQTNGCLDSYLIAGHWSIKCLAFCRIIIRSLWSPPFYHARDVLLYGLLFGILHTNNIIIAYVLAFWQEWQTVFSMHLSQFDGSFSTLTGTANILIKAFVSSGQFLLPLIISLLVWAELWFGWSFMIAAGIMFINALFLYLCTFPPHPGHRLPVIKKTTSSTEHRCSIIDLASYTLYGYISMATFYLVSQWLAQYGQFVAGMSYTMSIKLLSIYTVVRCCYLLPLHSFVIPFAQQHY
ncbi:Inner membrane transport protein YdiM [Escherichia coli]|nr:Inner membrane transport protein YdiM [Escherichia coli]